MFAFAFTPALVICGGGEDSIRTCESLSTRPDECVSTMGAPTLLLILSTCFILGGTYSQASYPEENSEADQAQSKCLQAKDLPLDEGRAKMKKKGRLLISLLLGLKLLGLSVAIPLIIALALYSAWKGVTISLLAFMIASIVGLKSLISKSHDDKSHNVIVAKIPGSQQDQWWRRLGGDFVPLGVAGLDPYRAYGFPATF